MDEHPYEIVTGEKPEISEYAIIKWYQVALYLDTSTYLQEHKEIGHWI